MPVSSLLPPSLERFLQLTSEREQIISANMANVDTPGYHTKDVNFKQTLLQAGEDNAVGDVLPAVRPVDGLIERPDGNNVDLDHESMLLAQTQLQYSLGTQLIKAKFHQLLSAINGGN